MFRINAAGAVVAAAAVVVVVSDEPDDEHAPVFAQTAMMIITMIMATTKQLRRSRVIREIKLTPTTLTTTENKPQFAVLPPHATLERSGTTLERLRSII
jgi:hypothetical protein